MSSKSKQVTYQNYLKISELLSLQKPLSSVAGKLAHDEMLFIIIHQIYELWFKQILHELDSVLNLFQKESINERHMGIIVSQLERIIVIQKILIEQITVIETMSPADFLEFRDLLAPASGFQSIQFRLLEIKMGLEKGKRILFEKQAFSSALNMEEKAILEKAEKCNVDIIITTEKDMVKLKNYNFDEVELFSLAIQFQIEKTAEQELFNIIDRKLSV